MADAPIIVADGVSKKFGDNQVLTRVTLPVMERDVVCIVGPSGSGKTTLLRCFALLGAAERGPYRDARRHVSTPSPTYSCRAPRARCAPTSAWCSSSSICGRT